MNSDIEKFMRLADKLERQSVDHNLSKAKEIADNWSITKGIDYVVVKNGGWQVWGKGIADRYGREYVYSTSVSTGGSDDGMV
jgi:hypothetical protein